MHTDNVTNLSRITVPASPPITHVDVYANIAWATNSTGFRIIRTLINGSLATSGPTDSDTAISGTRTHNYVGGGGLLAVSPGDYIEIRGQQNSGGDLNVDVEAGTWLEVRFYNLPHLQSALPLETMFAQFLPTNDNDLLTWMLAV